MSDLAIQERAEVDFLQTIEVRLCQLGNLVSGQFPITARPLVRGGKDVGQMFCLHGPRSVKLTAIHDTHRGEIIYYGSDGVRRESMKL